LRYKIVFKNVLYVDLQVREEADMWQQFERLKRQKKDEDKSDSTGKSKSRSLGHVPSGLDPNNPSYFHDDRCEPGRSRDRKVDYWNRKSAKPVYLSTADTSYRHKTMQRFGNADLFSFV
jgi:hypothetical protein